MGKVIMGRRVFDGEEIEERAARAMSGLASLGVGEGDAVAMLLRNDVAFLEASLAIARLGAYAVPINWHAKSPEIAAVLADSSAKAVIAHADLVPALGATPVTTVAVGTPAEVAESYGIDPEDCRLPGGMHEWNAWLGTQPPWPAPPRRPRGSIVYTSGTTGLPKGIQREPFASPAEEQRLLSSLYESFGIRPGVRALVCGPLYHSMQAANLRAAYGALGTDGVLVIEARFDPERLLRAVDAHGITQILMVPVMFVRLLRLAENRRREFSLATLERVVHSAAPCPADTKRRMLDWFGPVLHEFYAASEVGAVTMIGPDDALRKPGSVGRALPGCAVKILDALGGELPAGHIGEVAALNRAYPQFTYRNRPEARAALDRAGLVATGDMGYIDEEGFLFLCGRGSDMVITGGTNVFPADVEEALLSCPGVADCAVFGIPDPEFGEALAAHVQLADGARLSEAQIRVYLEQRLPGYQRPRVIRLERALPREESGKIFKRRLRDAYWRDRG